MLVLWGIPSQTTAFGAPDVTEVPTVKVNRALKAFHRSYVRNINDSWYMHQGEVQMFNIVILSSGQMSSKNTTGICKLQEVITDILPRIVIRSAHTSRTSLPSYVSGR